MTEKYTQCKKHEKYLLVSTFWAESTAKLTLSLAFSFHLHLVWRTNAHTGATVHHKMSYKERENKLRGRLRITGNAKDPPDLTLSSRTLQRVGQRVFNSTNRSLTGALWDTDGSVLIFGIRVGLHLKCLLVVDQSLGTLGHTGSRVIEVTTCL